MFGNKSLTTSKKNDRFFAPWLSSLGPWSNSLTPFSTLRDEIMDVFDNFNLVNIPSPSTSFMPKVEIKDQGTSYLISAEVPGMSDKDMSVTVRDNCLILEGEKKEEHKEDKKGYYRSELNYGSFYRAIPLSEEINPEKISASYKHGVLRVEIEKTPESQRKSKKIPIKIEKSGEGVETKH